jgi:hypothetical protein
MKTLLAFVCVLCMMLPTGCAKIILKADFQGWPSGSPAGHPPGPPSDDQILVGDSDNPVVQSSALKFDHNSTSNTFFFSHPITEPEATKTIFWRGNYVSGDGTISFMISGHSGTPVSTFLGEPIHLKLIGNEFIIIDAYNNLLFSTTFNQNLNHDVSVTLQIKSKKFKISMRQPEVPEIVYNGQISDFLVNELKNATRVVMKVDCLNNQPGQDEYRLYEVIMRERD